VPIKIPNDLPAGAMLRAEGVRLIGEDDALRQDIRPLQIALLNLMPEKPKTETQLARLLGATPLQIELTLLTTSTYQATTTPLSHLQSFYRTWNDVRDRKFDGMIITGAPVEMLPFEDVLYWKELSDIFDWTQDNVHSTLDICWGAQAALYHFHRVPKHTLSGKKFGVYPHRVRESQDAARPALVRGFDDVFYVPVSRHTETREEDLPRGSGLEVLATSNQAGLCLMQDLPHRHILMFNHLEYDTLTLQDEFLRDLGKRADVALPENYYPYDDPDQRPRNRWRAYAHLLFGNWINEIYQTVPYQAERIGRDQLTVAPQAVAA
jgi:homoserine O-succinyltransferase